MKYLIFFLLLLSVNLSAIESKDYYKAYDQKGFKTTIQEEIERGANYTILEVDIINTDAQSGPFSIIAAAVKIGTDLRKTHFTVIKEYEKEKRYYYKIFFTSDINEDPAKAFPNEMSQDKLDKHSEIGYLSIATYSEFFKGVKSN
jgi:hypothetical protein